MQLFTWLTGSFAALSTYLPQSVAGLLYAAAILTFVDTITGYAIARRRGTTNSFTMRLQLASKCGQFLIILGMGAAGALVARAWAPIGLSFAALIAIEFSSNLENLVWLELNGGAPLGPARPILMKIAAVLGLGPKEAGIDVSALPLPTAQREDEE